MMRRILSLLSLLAPGGVFGQVAVPDPGMHRSAIRQLSVVEDGTRMAALSEDGAVLLWNLADGSLMRTFYIPFSGAVRPEAGAMVLTPGGARVWMTASTETSPVPGTPLYAFNTATGLLDVRTVVPLPQIKALQIVANRLVALGTQKMLFMDMDRTRVLAELIVDDGAVLTTAGTSVLVVSARRAVQVSVAGVVETAATLTLPDRPLGASLRSDTLLIAVRGGSQPVAVRFPGGQPIALPVLPAGRTDAIAFDRMNPMAAGLDVRGVPFIARLERGGWKAGSTPPAGAITVLQPAGRQMAAGGGLPFWALLERGEPVYTKEPALFTFNRIDRSGFWLDDADFRSAGVHPAGSAPLFFSVRQRAFIQEIPAGRGPRDRSKTVAIDGWKNRSDVTWNGRPVRGTEGLTFYSCDIASDGRSVLGGRREIVLLDSAGAITLRVPVASLVWNLRFSAEKNEIAAALGDGSVRWFNAANGREIAALLLHTDRRRWALFTPDGYADASPGALALLSWLIPRGVFSEPLQFNGDRLRERLFKPDTLDARLGLRHPKTGQDIGTLAQAPPLTSLVVEHPPSVSIVSPVYGAVFTQTALTFRLTVATPDSAPVTSVLAYIDGRPAETTRSTALGTRRNESAVTLQLPGRDCTVSFVAGNRFGYSKPEIVALHWGGSTEKNALKPTLYVLAIGTGTYGNGIPPLQFPSKDARDFSTFWKTQSGLLYKSVQTRVLTQGDATKNAILDGFEWIQRQTTSRDVAMIFMAGHGLNDANGVFYFVPADADPDAIKRTCVIDADIRNTLAAIPGKVLFFVDACHSGNILGNRRSGGDVRIDQLVNDLSSAENGVVVFTSSTGRQYSLERDEWANGAFTKALVEGLSGRADLFNRNVITLKTLDAYTADRVKQLTGGQQSPTVIIPQSIPDYPIAVKKTP